MARHPLHDLVRRRLWELGRSAEDASWRSGWVLPPETIQRLARGRGRSTLTAGLAVHLARALDVPENRVRRGAGAAAGGGGGAHPPDGPPPRRGPGRPRWT